MLKYMLFILYIILYNNITIMYNDKYRLVKYVRLH